MADRCPKHVWRSLFDTNSAGLTTDSRDGGKIRPYHFYEYHGREGMYNYHWDRFRICDTCGCLGISSMDGKKAARAPLSDGCVQQVLEWACRWDDHVEAFNAARVYEPRHDDDPDAIMGAIEKAGGFKSSQARNMARGVITRLKAERDAAREDSNGSN